MAWIIDPTHSTLEFRAKHMMFTTVRGQFDSFQGTLNLNTENPAKSYVEGTVEVNSIDSGDNNRDNHLRSPDFFDAETHPEITFESTRIEVIDEDEFHVTGNLTMHGVTGEITLHVEVTGTEVDPWGNTRVGLEAQGELNRGDYEMKFNQALGSGNVLVSEKVRINVEVSAVKAS